MPKLITPVQFEPSLEGLNEVRPLIMPDECKTIISYPVLCQNLPSEGKPALGKLARCSHQGALLSNNSILPDKVYKEHLFFMVGEEHVSYTFPTKVQGVIVKYIVYEGVVEVWWCSPDTKWWFKRLVENEYIFLPFSGRRIYFIIGFEDGWQVSIKIEGFYR